MTPMGCGLLLTFWAAAVAPLNAAPRGGGAVNGPGGPGGGSGGHGHGGPGGAGGHGPGPGGPTGRARPSGQTRG